MFGLFAVVAAVVAAIWAEVALVRGAVARVATAGVMGFDGEEVIA